MGACAGPMTAPTWPRERARGARVGCLRLASGPCKKAHGAPDDASLALKGRAPQVAPAAVPVSVSPLP
jgi:hypothetical protein